MISPEKLKITFYSNQGVDTWFISHILTQTALKCQLPNTKTTYNSNEACGHTDDAHITQKQKAQRQLTTWPEKEIFIFIFGILWAVPLPLKEEVLWGGGSCGAEVIR